MSENKVFPKKGIGWDEIRDKLLEFRSKDIGSDDFLNRLTTGCHMGDDAIHKVCRDAWNMGFHLNGFLADLEPGMQELQQEILDMALEILNGGKEGRANLTVGGTESIFCALHAAREWARDNLPNAKEPYEVVVPWTAHAAFSKGSHYLGMKIKRVPVLNNYRADIEAMEKAIGPNTIFMVGSAPCWGIGRIDPIPELAEVAQRHGIWMHTDACVGGYLLPWLERIGCYDIPPFDFRVPGVCSISADLHKHGYAAKPCSTVLYRSEKLQDYHWVIVGDDDWQSGYYRTQSLVGSRPGAALYAAWAVLKNLGEDGYIDITRRALEVKNRLLKEISAMGDFECLENECLMVTFGSSTLNMLNVFAGMVQKGYVPFGTHKPPLVHLQAEPCDDAVVDRFISDLKDIVKGVKDGTIKDETTAKYGSAE